MFERFWDRFHDKQMGFEHTRFRKPTFLVLFMMIKRVCLSLYVSFSMTGRGNSNIHTCSTYFSSFETGDFECVCLIADFAFSMTGRGYSNIHTRLFFWFWRFLVMFKRVCFSAPVPFFMTGRCFSNIHACLAPFLFWWSSCFLSVYVWACMFEFRWQVEGFC